MVECLSYCSVWNMPANKVFLPQLLIQEDTYISGLSLAIFLAPVKTFRIQWVTNSSRRCGFQQQLEMPQFTIRWDSHILLLFKLNHITKVYHYFCILLVQSILNKCKNTTYNQIGYLIINTNYNQILLCEVKWSRSVVSDFFVDVKKTVNNPVSWIMV